MYLLRSPPSRDAFRHSGGESLLCTSETVTLYFDVELSKESLPGTEQNTSLANELYWFMAPPPKVLAHRGPALEHIPPPTPPSPPKPTPTLMSHWACWACSRGDTSSALAEAASHQLLHHIHCHTRLGRGCSDWTALRGVERCNRRGGDSSDHRSSCVLEGYQSRCGDLSVLV